MTDNIQKLYEIAGVVKKPVYSGSPLYNPFITGYEYPPFTAEKQFEILKFIVHSFGFNSLDKPIWDKGWDIAIAKLANFYWKVLSEKERKQIKEILQ